MWVLALPNKEALSALEKLTHATKKSPTPVMPLDAVADDCPAMFRRAAIHAALGSARSFYTHLSKWRKGREKAHARGGSTRGYCHNEPRSCRDRSTHQGTGGASVTYSWSQGERDSGEALRRVLYGLSAIITVHFAKEEEIYLPILDARLAPEEAHRMFLERVAQEAKSIAEQ